MNSGEERIGNDTITLSPSSSSGSRGHRDRAGRDCLPEERLRGERLATAAGLQDVFFQYNSAIFSNEARERLLHAASWLKGESKYRLLIEGHCDERETNAYNLVLGEKPRERYENFLRDQHLDAGRFSVVSYGKERPFLQCPRRSVLPGKSSRPFSRAAIVARGGAPGRPSA